MILAGSVRGAVLVCYILLTLLLGVVGFYYGLIAVERLVRSSTDGDPSPIKSHPTVTIQVPVYNERHVVDRILNAIGELDWPPSKLQVQVIDDSIDDTTDIIAAEIKPLRDRGIDVEHIQRDDRTGYKAGAT